MWNAWKSGIPNWKRKNKNTVILFLTKKKLLNLDKLMLNVYQFDLARISVALSKSKRVQRQVNNTFKVTAQLYELGRHRHSWKFIPGFVSSLQK